MKKTLFMLLLTLLFLGGCQKEVIYELTYEQNINEGIENKGFDTTEPFKLTVDTTNIPVYGDYYSYGVNTDITFYEYDMTNAIVINAADYVLDSFCITIETGYYAILDTVNHEVIYPYVNYNGDENFCFSAPHNKGDIIEVALVPIEEEATLFLPEGEFKFDLFLYTCDETYNCFDVPKEILSQFTIDGKPITDFITITNKVNTYSSYSCVVEVYDGMKIESTISETSMGLPEGENLDFIFNYDIEEEVAKINLGTVHEYVYTNYRGDIICEYNDVEIPCNQMPSYSNETKDLAIVFSEYLENCKEFINSLFEENGTTIVEFETDPYNYAIAENGDIYLVEQSEYIKSTNKYAYAELKIDENLDILCPTNGSNPVPGVYLKIEDEEKYYKCENSANEQYNKWMIIPSEFSIVNLDGESIKELSAINYALTQVDDDILFY